MAASTALVCGGKEPACGSRTLLAEGRPVRDPVLGYHRQFFCIALRPPRNGKVKQPVGQITSPYQNSCQALPRKIFLFRFSERYGHLSPSRLRMRGVSRSSRTLDAGCDGRLGCSARLSRGRKQSWRTAKACGPGPPDAGVKPEGDNLQVTEAIKAR